MNIQALRGLFVCLYTVSGLVVVAMETVWLQSIALHLGDSVYTASLVLAVFFAFASLGNAFGSHLLTRTQRPLMAYAFIELLFALLSCLSFEFRALIYGLWPGLGNEFARHVLIVISIVGLPSMLAGMSLPFVLKIWLKVSRDRIVWGALFYAANLLGSVIGVCSALLSVWYFGYSDTVWGIALLGVLAASVAAVAGSFFANDAASEHHLQQACEPERELFLPHAWTLILLLGSGLCTLALELLLMRYILLLMPATVYAVSSVLMAFLLGLSLSSFGVSMLRRKFQLEQLLAVFLIGSAVLTMLYPIILHSRIGGWGRQIEAVTVEGQMVETLWYVSILLLPLLCFVGGVFPLAWECLNRNHSKHAKIVAQSVSLNKIGAALGIVIGPWVLVKYLGLPYAFSVIAGFYMLMFWVHYVMRSRLPLLSQMAVSMMLVFLFFILIFRYDEPIRLNPDEHLLHVYSGPGSITAVVENEQQSQRIVLNQNYVLNGTKEGLLGQQQQGWLPMLLHENPKHVHHVGLASGISANAVLDFPVHSLTITELVPEVVKASKAYFEPWNLRLFSDPRARIINADGRYVLKHSKEKIDVVIADLFLPSNSSTANLYSLDFFEELKSTLSDEGIFCLWVPAYQLDKPRLNLLMRTFVEAFPSAIMIRGNYHPLQNAIALVGKKEPFDLSQDKLQERLEQLSPALRKQSPFLKSPRNAQLMLIGDLQANRAGFEDAALNTDNHPVFRFLAPLPLADDQTLRALTFLRTYGQWFEAKDWPSISSSKKGKDTLIKAIRASNHYFAYHVQAYPIPGISTQDKIRRTEQAFKHMRSVKQLLPGISLE